MPGKEQEQQQPSKASASSAGGSAALAQFEAPVQPGVHFFTGQPALPAQSKLSSLNHSVAQRSTIGEVMPGLAEPPEKGSGKRKKDDEKKPAPEKRETRGSKKPAANLYRPSFSFESARDGVATQKLDTEQAIGFAQRAILTRPPNAVNAASALYDFKQQVCDTYHHAVPNQIKALNAFVQDGPYRPPYNNPVIGISPSQIIFNDNPGFSTNAKVGAGQWLETYEVRFRWLVKRRDIASGTWTSPTAINKMECAYNAGNDVAITYTPAAAIADQEIVIPNA
jgi:hypothetical protein